MPAGTYIVKLSTVTAVASHEYVVDNAARVTEVNISTFGGEYARFYYLEPNAPQSTPGGIGQSTVDLAQTRVQEAVARAGLEDEAWRRVVKNYPTTTHVRTIEYRVSDKETLQKLFKSIEESWLNDKTGTFKP